MILAADLLEPCEKDFTLMNGKIKTFVLSKFTPVDGREIISQYPISGLPKLGEYKTNEQIMFMILARVAIKLDDGTRVCLSTKDLINNHCGDYETLLRIEYAMMEYNCSFFANGKLSSFLGDLGTKLQASIVQMLTTFLAQSPGTTKPPSKS